MADDNRAMTEIHIDISIYTESDAIGQISGEISVCTIPNIGDSISFDISEQDIDLDSDHSVFRILKVTNRIIRANGDSIVILLNDITVKSISDANKIMEYFESSYGLFSDRYPI